MAADAFGPVTLDIEGHEWGPKLSYARAAGVAWHTQDRRWRATINVIVRIGTIEQRPLGSFVKEVDAALVYDQSAREYHKDESKLNFPDLSDPPQMASSEQVRPVEGSSVACYNCPLTKSLRVTCEVCSPAAAVVTSAVAGHLMRLSRPATRPVR
jgi:hypothetical protein